MSDEISQMIEDCEKRQERMSEWEQSFIDSIAHQLARNGSLSPKQQERLEQIWERIT